MLLHITMFVQCTS